MQNISYFRNCIFETTGPLANPSIKPYAFAILNNVKNVRFQGCTFRNTAPTLFNVRDRGIGIVSIDAKYFVQQLSSTQFCKFENLYCGIDASNATNSNTVYVNKAQFSNNYEGIRLSAVRNATIISNTFTYIGGYTQNGGYGIYMDGCTGYKIEENNFSSGIGKHYGTIINNSGNASNEFYNNSFSNISYGTQIQENNSRLQLKCNQYTPNSIGIADISLTSGSIQNPQGACNIDPKSPAGNTFSHTCFNPTPTGDIWANPGVTPFTYNHHGGSGTTPQCYSSSIVNLQTECITAGAFNQTTSCPSKIIPPCNTLCQRQLIRQINTLSAPLVAGDAPALYQIIASTAAAGQIKNALLAPGAYLSDGVLIAAITRADALPPGHIKDIVIPNSPVTQPVKNALNNISLPNGIRNQITAAQTGTSARMQTETVLAALPPKDVAINDLLRQYLNDTTLANPMDTVIAFLKTQPDLSSEQYLLQAYLSNNSYYDARPLYNQLNALSDASFNSFYDLSISLSEQGKTIFEISSTGKQSLESLAVQTVNKEIATRAQSILRFVYGEPFPELIEKLEVSESLTINGFLNQNSACGTSAVGDTIFIVDALGNQVPDIAPVITDANGKFVFDYFDIAPLLNDSTTLYSFKTKGDFLLQNAGNKTLSDWITQSPVSLTLTGVKQAWASLYGGSDSLNTIGVAVDAGGCMYVLGISQILYTAQVVPVLPKNGIVTIKYDKEGNQLWDQRFEGDNGAMAIAMGIDGACNVYSAGTINANASVTGFVSVNDGIILKYDASGNFLWQKRVGHKAIKSIKIDNEGNSYIKASFDTVINYAYVSNQVVMKLNTNGELIWSTVFPGTYNDAPGSNSTLALDAANNVLVTGTQTNGTNVDFLTIKYDGSGNELWRRTIDISGQSDVPTAIDADNLGNIFVGGSTSVPKSLGAIAVGGSTPAPTGFGANFLTVKYNSSGQQQWFRQYLANGNITSLTTDKTGNVIATGGSGIVGNTITIKYDPNGNLVWVQPLSVGGVKKIVADDGGSTYITGIVMTQVTPPPTNTTGAIKPPLPAPTLTASFLTVKYDSSGTINWSQAYSIGNSSFNSSNDIALDESGNVFVTGFSRRQNSLYSDIATVMYSQCEGGGYSLRSSNVNNNETEQSLVSESQPLISIYPNPNNGEMIVNYFIPQNEKAEFSVYDLAGRKLKSFQLVGESNALSISEKDLHDGVYLYRIISNAKMIKQGKIVVIK